MALAMHVACRMAHVAWQDMKHEGRMFHCSHDQTAIWQKFMAEMKIGHENSDLGWQSGMNVGVVIILKLSGRVLNPAPARSCWCWAKKARSGWRLWYSGDAENSASTRY
jgi:hypothetical protein